MCNFMTNPTEAQKKGYTGVKVTSMLKALKLKEIFVHLRLVQQNNLNEIENRYWHRHFLTHEEMTLLWNLYWNFVLNDFRFEDKNSKYTTVSKVSEVEPKHFGLIRLKELENETN